VEIIKII